MTNEIEIYNKWFPPDSELSTANVLNAIKHGMDAAREDEAVGFAEWISGNQFTRYNNQWTSTKIHYSGCVYSTTELYQLYLKHKIEKL